MPNWGGWAVTSGPGTLPQKNEERSPSRPQGPQRRSARLRQTRGKAASEIMAASSQVTKRISSTSLPASHMPQMLCNRSGCTRQGRKLHHSRDRLLCVKGAVPQRKVTIHFFRCAIYWPRPWKNLHWEASGPSGEKVEILGAGRYRFTDAITGEVIETERNQPCRRVAKSDSIIRVCERKNCSKKGWLLRHKRVQLAVKGSSPQCPVIIHEFTCKDYRRPEKILHIERTGPQGEAVEELRPIIGRYRFRDARTGEVVETERRAGDHKISRAGKKRLRRSKKAWWKKNPDRRALQGEKMRTLRHAELIKVAEAERILAQQRPPDEARPIGRPPNTELERRVRELRATKPKPTSWARLKMILDRETGQPRAQSTYRGYAENS